MFSHNETQTIQLHGRIQKVLLEGVQLWQRFLDDKRRADPNTTKSWPPGAGHHWPGSKMPFIWHFAGGFDV